MLESMLPPETSNKIIAKLALLIQVILTFVALVMGMMTWIVGKPVDLPQADGTILTVIRVAFHHAHLWPMLFAFFCAGGALVMGGKKMKINLSYVVLIVGFWVLLNTILQKVTGPSLVGTGLGEALGPLMTPVGTMAGFFAFMGGACGILGVGKFMK